MGRYIPWLLLTPAGPPPWPNGPGGSPKRSRGLGACPLPIEPVGATLPRPPSVPAAGHNGVGQPSPRVPPGCPAPACGEGRPGLKSSSSGGDYPNRPRLLGPPIRAPPRAAAGRPLPTGLAQVGGLKSLAPGTRIAAGHSESKPLSCQSGPRVSTLPSTMVSAHGRSRGVQLRCCRRGSTVPQRSQTLLVVAPLDGAAARHGRATPDRPRGGPGGRLRVANAGSRHAGRNFRKNLYAAESRRAHSGGQR